MAAIATHWRLLPNVSDMPSCNVWIVGPEIGISTLHQGGSQTQMRIFLEIREFSFSIMKMEFSYYNAAAAF